MQGRDDGPGLCGAFHHGNQEGLDTDIQQFFQQGRIVIHGPHDGRHVIGRQHLQVGQDVRQLERRVLVVDQQPVKAGTGGNFRGADVRQAQPQAVLGPAGGHGALETVVR